MIISNFLIFKENYLMAVFHKEWISGIDEHHTSQRPPEPFY
ncbi:hypothetical protein FM109_14695 [Vibrio casei]|nr:hypothetical protein FM109_14695 [Vibrio casei]